MFRHEKSCASIVDFNLPVQRLNLEFEMQLVMRSTWTLRSRSLKLGISDNLLVNLDSAQPNFEKPNAMILSECYARVVSVCPLRPMPTVLTCPPRNLITFSKIFASSPWASPWVKIGLSHFSPSIRLEYGNLLLQFLSEYAWVWACNQRLRRCFWERFRLFLKRMHGIVGVTKSFTCDESVRSSMQCRHRFST